MEKTIIPPGRNCARITGIRRDTFVEFEFFGGDETLRIELILPFPAFQEFCAVNDVMMLTPSVQAAEHYDRLCWRYGTTPRRPDGELAR